MSLITINTNQYVKAVSATMSILVPQGTTAETVRELFSQALKIDAETIRVNAPTPYMIMVRLPDHCVPESPEELFIRTHAEDPETALKTYLPSISGPFYLNYHSSISLPTLQIGGVRIIDGHALKESPAFKEYAKFCLNYKLTEFRKNALKGDFTTPFVAEVYADQRKIKGKQFRPHLNLFQLGCGGLVSLIEEVIDSKKPFRCQILLNQGHFTCLDLKFDQTTRSMVVLDSVNEFGPNLSHLIPRLIDEFQFKVFLVKEPTPSLSYYKTTISKVPKELEKKIEAPKNTGLPFDITPNPHRFLFCFEGEKWVLKSDHHAPQIIEDTDLIQTSNESELITLLYKTNLTLPSFVGKNMQTDTAACGSFALYFAIRAGKTDDLHERCAAVDQNDPLIPRLRIGKENIVYWKHLPSKFTKWSQSETLRTYKSKSTGSIAVAMRERVKKTLEKTEVTDLQMRSKRLATLLSQASASAEPPF